VTFFCGGSRNFTQFIELFDGVFVLEVERHRTARPRRRRHPSTERGSVDVTVRSVDPAQPA
jgi:hypothetical protein